MEKLPPAFRSGIVDAYAASLQDVFRIAIPIGVGAFLLTWLLPEIELRTTTRAVDPGDTFAMPSERTPAEEVDRAVTLLAARENRLELYSRLADRAGLDLGPRECWLLYRFDDHPTDTLAHIAGVVNRPEERLTELADSLRDKGLLSTVDDQPGHRLTLTGDGREAIARLLEARRARLAEMLGDWSPAEHPELIEHVEHLARVLMADDDKMLEAARGHSGPPTS